MSNTNEINELIDAVAALTMRLAALQQEHRKIFYPNHPISEWEEETTVPVEWMFVSTTGASLNKHRYTKACSFYKVQN